MNKNWLARLFDWISEVFDIASPSIYKMLSTVVPYLAPVPVALLTAQSSIKYLGMYGWGAGIFVFVLDGIGILATVTLVSVLVDFIRSRNVKTAFMVLFFAALNFFYVRVVVDLNVKLAVALGNADPTKAEVLTLVSFLPILAGLVNGYFILTSKQKTEIAKAQDKQEEIAERIRQEQMDFKLKKAAMKHGFNPFASTPVTLNQDVPQVKEKHAGSYKDYVMELLDQNGELALTEITKLVNKNKRVQLVHRDVKGTWFKFVQEWKRSNGNK